MVQNDHLGKPELVDQVSWTEEGKGELKTVFEDGQLMVDQSFVDIRSRVQNGA